MRSLQNTVIIRFTPAFVLLCLVMCSCNAHRSTHVPAKPSVEWGQKTPAELLDDLKQQQARIHDLTAHFSLNIQPPPPGGFSNLQGIIFFKRDAQGPSIRVKAMAPFGRVLFDMVRTGRHMEIFIPSRETLYSGNPETAMNRKDTVGQAMMGIFKGVSDAEAQPGSSLVISGDTVILPLTDGELRLDRVTGLLMESFRSGKVIHFQSYEKSAGAPPLPTRISVKNVLEPGEALFRLSRVRLNSHPGDVFDLSGYTPRYLRGLDALGRSRRDQ